MPLSSCLLTHGPKMVAAPSDSLSKKHAEKKTGGKGSEGSNAFSLQGFAFFGWGGLPFWDLHVHLTGQGCGHGHLELQKSFCSRGGKGNQAA